MLYLIFINFSFILNISKKKKSCRRCHVITSLFYNTHVDNLVSSKFAVVTGDLQKKKLFNNNTTYKLVGIINYFNIIIMHKYKVVHLFFNPFGCQSWSQSQMEDLFITYLISFFFCITNL